MCCVTIGYREFLLPADKGMKVVELMQHAVECDHEYVDSGYVYRVQEEPRVEFKLVKASQIRMPQGQACPIPSKPRLLK